MTFGPLELLMAAPVGDFFMVAREENFGNGFALEFERAGVGGVAE